MSEYVIPESVMAALTIFAEARSESFEGQVAVGNVIRNRMARKYASDGTVAGTVLAKRQFSCWNHDDRQRIRVAKCDLSDPRFATALRAWIASANRDIARDAVLYHTVERPAGVADWPPSWAHSPVVEEVKVIGAHIFYADRGA